MRLQEEIRELEQRFAGAPDSRLFLPLADALRRAGELDRAVKLCREGLQRYPDFNSARILLGETLAELGELNEAGQVLEQAASQDGGNRRIMVELADIAGKKGDEPSAEQVKTEPSAEQERHEAPAEFNSEAGEMFITHTLGDIYRMQGHDLKALEVYRKLIGEGHDDPVLKRKAEELDRRLAEDQAAAGPDAALSTAPREEPAVMAGLEEPPAVGEGPFEERIDAIFHFLLGDSPEYAETAGKGGAGHGSGGDNFVDILENWIDDLKQGM